MGYRLEKQVDGEWCLWGIYDTMEEIAKASFDLGKNAGCVEAVRVREQTQEGDAEW